MKKSIITIFAAAVGMSMYALDLADVHREIIAHDPLCRSLTLDTEAAHAAAVAENVLDAPEVDFEHLWGRGQNRWSLSVSEHFSWPGVYGATRDLANAQSDVARLGNALALADRSLQISLSMLDVVNARARIDFYAQVDSNLQRIADLTSMAYELGEATILDLRKTRLAMLDSHRELAAARAEGQSLIALLQAHGADVPPIDDPVWSTMPVLEIPASLPRAEAFIQFGLAEARRKAAAGMSKVIRMESMPSFSVGYVHAYEEMTHYNGLSVSVTLPSFSRNRRLKAANLAAEADMFRYDNELATAMAETAGQIKAAHTLKSAMSDYKNLADDNSYLDLLKAAFDGGELTIIEYIMEVNLFTASRLGYLDLLYRYNMAVFRANRYCCPETATDLSILETRP